MKKTVIILLTVALLAVMLTGCALTQDKAGYAISRAEARDVAFAAIGVDKAAATYTVISENENAAAPCYDVEIMVDGVVYRYRVDAAKGDILKITVNDQEVAPEALPKAEGASDADYIGLEEAKAVALADAGIAADEVLLFEYKMDYALGAYLYDLEFETATHEYEYEIVAESGDVFKKDVDGKTVLTPDAVTTPDGTDKAAYIGVEAAENAALAHAGKDRDKTVFEITKWKMKKGTAVYDVEFVSGGVEYEYTVNALTGAVIKAEKEGFDNADSGVYIGEEAAKAAALAHAGLTAEQVVFESVEPDVKNGKTVYEIEFRSGAYEYEYKINAENGDVLDVEKERD